VLRNHGELSDYIGPRFMVRYQYLAMHPKDTLDRRGAVRFKGGVGFCNITKCCQEVCPEHIHITDNSIIPLKERVADESFDPVRRAAQKVMGRANQRPKESQTGPGVVGGRDMEFGRAHLGDLKEIVKRKGVRSADRAKMRVMIEKIENEDPLTYQEQRLLETYLNRYRGAGAA
jgi:hypothetical protein